MILQRRSDGSYYAGSWVNSEKDGYGRFLRSAGSAKQHKFVQLRHVEAEERQSRLGPLQERHSHQERRSEGTLVLFIPENLCCLVDVPVLPLPPAQKGARID